MLCGVNGHNCEKTHFGSFEDVFDDCSSQCVLKKGTGDENKKLKKKNEIIWVNWLLSEWHSPTLACFSGLDLNWNENKYSMCCWDILKYVHSKRVLCFPTPIHFPLNSGNILIWYLWSYSIFVPCDRTTRFFAGTWVIFCIENIIKQKNNHFYFLLTKICFVRNKCIFTFAITHLSTQWVLLICPLSMSLLCARKHL